VSFTPTKPGKIAYFCSIHPFMKATLTVAGGS
jgi:plastocyanin